MGERVTGARSRNATASKKLNSFLVGIKGNYRVILTSLISNTTKSEISCGEESYFVIYISVRDLNIYLERCKNNPDIQTE